MRVLFFPAARLRNSRHLAQYRAPRDRQPRLRCQ
jgi:hypothetical protein